MRGTSEFGEWFLLQPSVLPNDGWLGPVLGRQKGAPVLGRLLEHDLDAFV